MTIQPISAASIALYLTPTDLQERGLRADEITAQCALELTRAALNQAGLSLQEPLEIESFADKSGLLLFVHICPPHRTIWSFEDLESLLAASTALQITEPDSSLFRWGDRLWLVCEGECPVLSEFGVSEQDDPYIHNRLIEYGTHLLTGQVLTTLHDHF